MIMHRFKSVAKGDEALPKRMAPPEREARLTRQREQLSGLSITGPMEPAHGLSDLCAAMIEKNEISYISVSKCLSRQQELVVNKPKKEFSWTPLRQRWSSRSSHHWLRSTLPQTWYLPGLATSCTCIGLDRVATYEISRNGSIGCFQFTLNLLPLASRRLARHKFSMQIVSPL